MRQRQSSVAGRKKSLRTARTQKWLFIVTFAGITFVGTIQLFLGYQIGNIKMEHYNQMLQLATRFTTNTTTCGQNRYDTGDNNNNSRTLMDPFPDCRNNTQYSLSVEKRRIPVTKEDSPCCGQINLPLNPYHPPECWPRVFLTPSFPTGGSELVRRMFEKLTGVLTLHAYDFIGPQALTFKSNNESKLPVGTFGEDYNDKCQLQLPYAGRATLLKTHEGLSKDKFSLYREEFFLFHSDDEKDDGVIEQKQPLFSGIIRLARNPGDQILRNNMRWDREAHKLHKTGKRRRVWMTPKQQLLELAKRKGKTLDFGNSNSTTSVAGSDELDVLEARKFCAYITRDKSVEEWLNFHTFWEELDPSLPQWIWHYERGTQKDTAVQSYRELLEFVSDESQNNLLLQLGDSTTKIIEDKILNFVKEPAYKQGAFLADICGLNVAKIVHEKTKNVTKKLGYLFDETTGHWSI